MTTEREGLLKTYEAARIEEGRISDKHAALIRQKQAAVSSAREAIKLAEELLRQAYQDSRVESSPAEQLTARLDGKLRSLLPAAANAATGRLAAAIEYLREVHDRNKAQSAQLRRLLELSAETREWHLLPDVQLTARINEINAVIDRREAAA